ncbi:FecR family protein [Alkalispirochaeta americana]|uniref:FecR family protein n=1 Tax=Alkalispirochaeta americana TaxID=159291 RepID=A0A1N6WII8_9SPIO|nr:FecR domain-containing protein [Alkalispirochaeta americana]SIQ89929.1 FecR family protein [Alkalispirochaeta americana]
MKKLIARASLLGALLIAAAFPALALEARIASVQGKVEIRTDSSAPWITAVEGMTIPLGATISTGFNSLAEVTVGPATLQVRALSRMRLDELIEQEGVVQSDLHLQVGRVRADVRSAEGLRSEFRLSSPIATAAVRGTSFEFDGTTVQVESGSVQLANQYNEAVPVGTGESTSSTGDEPPPPPSESREAAAVVVAFTPGAEESGDRQEGVLASTAPTTGGIRVNWSYEY